MFANLKEYGFELDISFFTSPGGCCCKNMVNSLYWKCHELELSEIEMHGRCLNNLIIYYSNPSCCNKKDYLPKHSFFSDSPTNCLWFIYSENCLSDKSVIYLKNCRNIQTIWQEVTQNNIQYLMNKAQGRIFVNSWC